jgi:hypothetical protein
MNSIKTLSFAAGLIVSAGALYQSHDTQRDICLSMQSQAISAAQAPIAPKAASVLGFTPMAQFQKAYPPACQPPDTGADIFSSLTAGALVMFGCYFFGIMAARFKLFNHKERKV